MTNSPSRDLAVKYALENKWEEAYEENKKLLEEDPDSIDTLNRIAYTLVKLNKFKKAKEFYQKVLKLDKTNPIAVKNVRRIDTMSQGSGKDQPASNQNHNISFQDVFIEEAGKTKTLELKNVADRKTLSILQPGDSVALSVKRSKIFVQMSDKTYVGVLPDNVGMRMISFINGGNEYSACVKAVGDNSVTVFIKETKKMARFKNQPSFLTTPGGGSMQFLDK
ncbi:MAG TPA: tetratricopeptide repeat protein [Patescibacteria group bacterium]|nr:tetratricopeptide repeat protein [Patescibacteria group bacterium]